MLDPSPAVQDDGRTSSAYQNGKSTHSALTWQTGSPAVDERIKVGFVESGNGSGGHGDRGMKSHGYELRRMNPALGEEKLRLARFGLAEGPTAG